MPGPPVLLTNLWHCARSAVWAFVFLMAWLSVAGHTKKVNDFQRLWHWFRGTTPPASSNEKAMGQDTKITNLNRTEALDLEASDVSRMASIRV
jgi:hypothetical protein